MQLDQNQLLKVIKSNLNERTNSSLLYFHQLVENIKKPEGNNALAIEFVRTLISNDYEYSLNTNFILSILLSKSILFPRELYSNVVDCIIE